MTSLDEQVQSAVAELRRLATSATREGMVRYAIPADRAFGVAVGDIRRLAKQLGRNHALACALWPTGHYEARLLAAFLADPKLLTAQQMESWCLDFDSWAVCDTACFHLFDRAPLAWTMVDQWAIREEEFVKRAAFALLASMALHDKRAADALFLNRLTLIENAASDSRNFVKKAVVWALRGIGGRGPQLHAAALECAQRLAVASDSSRRWVGKTVARELRSAASLKRLAKQLGTDKKRE